MSVVKNIKKDLEAFHTAKSITGVLRDISAMKIGSLREEFEKNRNFYDEISDLYRLVKARFIDTKKQGVESKNGKKSVLYVALTSNKRFYGALNRQIIEKCLKALSWLKKGDGMKV